MALALAHTTAGYLGYEAIRCYLIASAIRDLRLHTPAHRSMLVNVSQWTRVQNEIAAILGEGDGHRSMIGALRRALPESPFTRRRRPCRRLRLRRHR